LGFSVSEIGQVEEHEIYPAIGSEGFERLIAAFYRRVPGDEVLGPMYPANDLAGAEKRLRGFLIYRFGGPADYIAERGHPRLGMRHGRFQIGDKARQNWLRLMDQAFEEAQLPEDAETVLRNFFENTAAFLRNQP
jgi:hemoglobin